MYFLLIEVEILNRDAWVKHFPNSHPHDQNLCGGVLLTCSRIIETPLYLRGIEVFFFYVVCVLYYKF